MVQIENAKLFVILTDGSELSVPIRGDMLGHPELDDARTKVFNIIRRMI